MKKFTLLFSILLLASWSVAFAQETTPAPTNDSTEIEKLQTELKRDQKRLEDWPNLNRYREANSQVEPLTPGEQRVVFMGDSITDIWGRRRGTFFPGKPYINRGISGQTTAQMLLRFRPDVINLHPKAVVILAGTNDIAGNTGPATLDEIMGNLESMAQLAKANGIRVVLASVTPDCDSIKVQSVRRPPEKIVELNGMIKDYATKNSIVYLDYYSALADDHGLFKQDLTYDCLHPNAAGFDVMGPLAEKAIKATLSEARPNIHANPHTWHAKNAGSKKKTK